MGFNIILFSFLQVDLIGLFGNYFHYVFPACPNVELIGARTKCIGHIRLYGDHKKQILFMMPNMELILDRKYGGRAGYERAELEGSELSW